MKIFVLFYTLYVAKFNIVETLWSRISIFKRILFRIRYFIKRVRLSIQDPVQPDQINMAAWFWKHVKMYRSPCLAGHPVVGQLYIPLEVEKEYEDGWLTLADE